MLPGGDHEYVASIMRQSDLLGGVAVWRLRIPDPARIGRMENALSRYWSFTLYNAGTIGFDSINDINAIVHDGDTVYVVMAPKDASDATKKEIKKKADQLNFNYFENMNPDGWDLMVFLVRQVMVSDENPYKVDPCPRYNMLSAIYQWSNTDIEPYDTVECFPKAHDAFIYELEDFLNYNP